MTVVFHLPPSLFSFLLFRFIYLFTIYNPDGLYSNTIKPGIKPYQQPLRKMHPKLEPLTQNEVKKLLDVRIIFKVRNSEWVSNLVPVRKKSRETRLCVDFRNLNRASDKDNYPVPPMEQILQMVSRFELFS